jgi:hypothetical protein
MERDGAVANAAGLELIVAIDLNRELIRRVVNLAGGRRRERRLPRRPFSLN